MQSSIVSTDQIRIAGLVHAYLAAEYRWELDGDWLSLHIGEAAPAVARRFPGAAQFGLLSAWNPHSAQRPEPVNRAADDMLQQELLDSGHVYRPAFSSAANRSWREPSWLVVDMPLSDFDALSRHYGQLATLHWMADEAIRMRVDTKPPPGFEANPDIDWLRI
jgi:hypothetical protein